MRLPVLVAVSLAATLAHAQASAVVQTTPIASGPTAANDTAVWLHPTDLARSLVFGTDQVSGALISYGLDGTVRQSLNLGLTMGVDVKYQVSVDGNNRDVVLALGNDGAFRLLTPDRDAGFLTPIDNGATPTLFAPGAGALYVARGTGTVEIFVADQINKVRHYRAQSTNGKLVSTLSRTVTMPGPVQGMAVDDLRKNLYLTVLNKGLYVLQAEPDGILTPTLIEAVDAGHLEGAAGVALYLNSDGGGYIIASASQQSRYSVYALNGTNPFITSFAIVADGGGFGATGSRGIDVTPLPLNATFPKGMFVAHDPNNATGPNYKLVQWDAIAAPPLLVDTRLDPRTWIPSPVDAGKVDAGPKDAGPVLPICPIPVDAGPSDGGDAGDPDAGAPVDAGPCMMGTGGGGGSGTGGAGGGFPPLGGNGGTGGGLTEPMGCGCGTSGLMVPLAALAWLVARRRRQG